MAIVQRNADSVNRRRPAQVAGPTADIDHLTIKGTVYHVEAIPPGEDGTAAFVLTKPNGDTYAIIHRHDGILACDCPDWVCRRDGITHTPCKHGAALVAAGLLKAPTPPLAPDPAPALPSGNIRARRLAEATTARQSTPEARQGGSDAGTDETTVEAPAACCDAKEAAPCHACAPTARVEEPTADNWAEYGRWSAGDDVEAEEAHEPRLTLSELIDHEADRYRKVGTLAGLLIGNHLAALASSVRLAQTDHPAVAMDRIATMERDHAAALERDHAATLADLARA
jgi:hypothetical protein